MFKQIEEFVKWHRRRNPDSRTWRDYKYDLNQFVEVIGEREPHTIKVPDIDQFVVHQSERGLSPKTINRRLTALTSFFIFLSDVDPSIGCPILPHRHILKEKKRLPRPVPVEEIEAFFAVIDNVRDKAMFQLMLRCGLRIAEVASLKVADLFLKEVRPRMIVLGKNSTERTIYLSIPSMKLVKHHLALRHSDEEELFLSYQGKRMSTTAIHKRLMVYRTQAGLTFTCHQLRHTFATDLVEANVPVPTIQKLMGHAWITTTQGYLAVSDLKVANDYYDAAKEMEAWE
jgi:site-specific recombinase XerD